MNHPLTATGHARIRHQQLLSQVTFSTTQSLLSQMQMTQGSKVLCLNCGEGDVVFYFSGLVGLHGTVTGTDPYAENILTAQQVKEIKKLHNVSFYQSDHFKNGKSQQFNFIHCRLPLIWTFNTQKLINVVIDQLQEGGIILFEVIDFSGFNSIQDNYAFRRFLDLYAAFIKIHWSNAPFTSHLNEILCQSGFRQINHQYMAPSFLQGASKHLPSLTLECIMEEMIDRKLSSSDEVQVLLSELKSFEESAYSMISLPGIHQIWGMKA